MNHRFAVPVLTALLAAAPLFAGAAFVDVPAREIVVNAPLTPVGSQDLHAGAFGKADGQVAILMLEDFRMKARHSADGGATFGSEVQVPAAGQPDVLDAAASFASDGKIYLAYIDADLGGDTGLRFARSDDMGQTWTAPKILVAAGGPSIGVTTSTRSAVQPPHPPGQLLVRGVGVDRGGKRGDVAGEALRQVQVVGAGLLMLMGRVAQHSARRIDSA